MTLQWRGASRSSWLHGNTIKYLLQRADIFYQWKLDSVLFVFISKCHQVKSALVTVTVTMVTIAWKHTQVLKSGLNFHNLRFGGSLQTMYMRVTKHSIIFT